jgi:hypothetical protein
VLKKQSAKIFYFWHSVNFLPSVFLTLGKKLIYQVFYFTECFLFGTGQRHYLPSAQKKHSAKHLALDKELNSDNDMNEFIFLTSKDEFLTNKYTFELLDLSSFYTNKYTFKLKACSFNFNSYQLLLFIYYFCYL